MSDSLYKKFEQFIPAEQFVFEQVSIRLVKEQPILSDKPIKYSDQAIDLVGRYMIEMDRECLCCINLRTNGIPINFSIIAVGTLSSCLVVPREVFKCSILSNAEALLLVHNHPSGSISPSKEDKSATLRIKDSCNLLGIKFIDHIIVGTDTKEYYSLNGDTKCPWPKP